MSYIYNICIKKIKYKYKANRGAHRKQAPPFFKVLMKKNKTTAQSRYLQNEDIGIHKPHS